MKSKLIISGQMLTFWRTCSGENWKDVYKKQPKPYNDRFVSFKNDKIKKSKKHSMQRFSETEQFHRCWLDQSSWAFFHLRLYYIAMFWLWERCPPCFFASRCADGLTFLFMLLFLISCIISIGRAKRLMWPICGNQSLRPDPSTTWIIRIHTKRLTTTAENWWWQQWRSNCLQKRGCIYPQVTQPTPAISSRVTWFLNSSEYVHTMLRWVPDFCFVNLIIYPVTSFDK